MKWNYQTNSMEGYSTQSWLEKKELQLLNLLKEQFY